MDRTAAQRREIADEGDQRALAGQIRLLEAKRAEVEGLRRRRGKECDDELANDFAGIRFVLRAALLTSRLTVAERNGLERREREARELLREDTA